MPANLNTRSNIFVLIDEAHRTTGGDLGNFLMAGLPNASFIGLIGTPVDKTAYGCGPFKTFGCEGVADIEELNKILDRAVNLKSFLKGRECIVEGGPIRGRSLSGECRAAGLQGVSGRYGSGGVRALQGGACRTACRNLKE